MRFLAIVLASLIWAVPAHAEWHEASSDNFVVYADDKAADVEKFTLMLERYHSALELLTGRKIAKPSPSNRVTIFAVGNTRKVAKLATGDSGASIAGFYVPRAGASRAFVPDVRISHRETRFSMTVLLHEYAHHFLIGTSRYSMPAWLREGSAEFFASARFPKDGSVHIGRPAYHREGDFAYSAEYSVRDLVDPSTNHRNGGYYAWAWALYHHLNFDPGRQGQLSTYWRALASGVEPMQAAQETFGDLEILQGEVEASLKKRMMSFYNLKPDMLPTPTVTVRRLSEGHGEVMPLIIRSQRGVNRETALDLLPDVQEVAAEYPDDPWVLAALAEAEHDAGNYTASIAAADKAIAANPTVKNAYVQKGFSLFALAEDAEPDAQEAAYAGAMEPFSALNKLENDHPLPLIYYYQSYVQRGEPPSELARAALEQAAALAPFDQGLWLQAAIMQGYEGQVELARLSLSPLASDPHGGARSQAAAIVVSELAELPDGEPVSIPELLSAAMEGDEGGDGDSDEVADAGVDEGADNGSDAGDDAGATASGN